jgi:hypothetical protein
MRISFLHTINGNRRIFDDAASELGLPIAGFRHEVRPDLREAVQAAGEITPGLRAEANRCLLDLAAGADAVIVTCATLGPVADAMHGADVPIVRADKALAVAAANTGGRIVVLCAVESTIEPNRRLFEEPISDAATSVEIVHVESVWTCYKNGDLDGCFDAAAKAADKAYREGATVVAFAHPWMAPAAKLIEAAHRPLDSAHVALRAIQKRLA